MLAVLGSIGDEDLGQFVNQFGSLEGIKLKAFDQIVKTLGYPVTRGDRCGRFTPADLGPGNIARLRHHRIARLNGTLIDSKLHRSVSSEKDDLIAELLPEVDKPGDPERASCSLQHALCVINLVISVQMLALSRWWVLMEQPNFLAKSWILIARSKTPISPIISRLRVAKR